MEENKNYFKVLNAIDVNDKVEKKNGLTYLSWAWAWGEVKKFDPFANYKVYETIDGINYFNDGRTGWVKTGVIVNGIEHIEYLPIMDYKNKSIPLEQITSFDVNKTIQRSLTKAVARHGLGLYIYAGEDLPESEEEKAENNDFKKEDNKIIKQDIKTSKNAEIKGVDNDLPFLDIQEKNIHALEIVRNEIEKNCKALKKEPDVCYKYFCKEWKVNDPSELNEKQLNEINDKLVSALFKLKQQEEEHD